MTDAADRDYFRKRAQQERAFAASCEDKVAALVHMRMADEYERRVAPETLESAEIVPIRAHGASIF